MRLRSPQRAQTAMEWLGVYGWSMLAVAFVVVVLFELGVFSGSGPNGLKAYPGSCRVINIPNVGSTLFGVCRALLPQTVLLLQGHNDSGGGGNHAGGKILVTNALKINTDNGGFNTVTFWMRWSGHTNVLPFSFYGPSGVYDLWLSGAPDDRTDMHCFGFNTQNGDDYGINYDGLVDRWVFVGAVFYNGLDTGNNQLYINGLRQNMAQCNGNPPNVKNASATFTISSLSVINAYNFNGTLSNFQIYNTGLDDAAMQAIYAEGIGGAPTKLNNLVAWYPLNRNPDDYSGNGNKGTEAYAVNYTSVYNYP